MPRDNLECKVYVGELGNNGDQHELEEAFGYYGPLRSVWVARNPPGFAFIEFEDSRDAEDAVKGLNGRKVCGRHISVEMSNGKRRGPMRGRRGGRDGDQGCFNCGSLDHYARECTRREKFRRRSRSRSRGRSPRGRSPYSRASPYGRSRSRSHSPRRKGSR